VATPAGATVVKVDAVAGYAKSSCSSPERTVCNTAGGYFQSRALVSDASVWGVNELVQDTAETMGANLIGNEIDLNTNGSPSLVMGLQITGLWRGTMPLNSWGINIEGGPQQLGTGIEVSDGATFGQGALVIGARSASGTSVSSQLLAFNYFDSGGTEHQVQEWVDASDNFNFVGGITATGAKNFKIDHPLDPANKYLYHTSVESPDMMNIYNGNVVLDAKGEAEIQLPDWFEALNRDFRYQLSCIGSFAPVYVAAEIQNNSFRIAGGTSGLKVSWQVTGIRHDVYADAHCSPVEVEKPAEDRGRYLHPELFGASRDKAVGAR
jgi:trimeric autotransporter adhesin